MDAQNLMWEMQLKRYEIFKAQDIENSHFDVTFEVDGKKIYANKYLLETLSKPFYAMFSEQWSSKNDVIKLETYNYESFYRFLTFFYSAACDLSDENVLIMLDMAEFYDVAEFKDFCDDYISKMEFDIDKIFVVNDLITKYSLQKTKEAFDENVKSNFSNILQSDQFMSLEKSAIETLVSFQRSSRHEEELFEAVFKWAENQFISDEIPTKRKYFNMNESIKAVLSTILPNIKFNRMNPEFLYKFVVPKGYLFTYEELGAILYEHQKITVTVTDFMGKSLSGSFVECFNVYDAIKKVGSTHPNWRGPLNWSCKDKPSKPSNVKKSDSAEYYLILANRRLQVKKPSDVNEDDYILCEMKGDYLNFTLDNNSKISCSRNCFDS